MKKKLYKRTCDLCGKNMISIYSLEKQQKVYCTYCWWSDKGDISNYFININLNISIFSQLKELFNKVPLLGNISLQSENSDYTNYGYQNKNCYLTFASDFNESCYYSTYLRNSKNSFDCLNVRKGILSYNLIDSNNCYRCFYSQRLDSCDSCYLSYELSNCNHCFGSSNLQGKSYYFFNIKLNKKDYDFKVNEWLSINELSFNEFNLVKNKGLSQSVNIVGSEKCQGDGISNSIDSYFCFDVSGISNSKYCSNGPENIQDCYDFDGVGLVSLSYESLCSGGKGSHHNLFCSHVRDGSSNLIYCFLGIGCSNCFGCIGLKNKQYCIFNKQYSKQEYEILVPKIIKYMQKIGERGEFFPIKYSPFKYNETIAQEYFPLMPEDIVKYKAKWLIKKPEVNISDGIKFIDPKTLISDPNLIDDSILNQAIICEESSRPFRIIRQELEFYRKYKIPLPHRHPDIRSLDRIKSMPKKSILLQTCNQCNNIILTSHKINHNIYCDICYNKKTFG